MNLFTNSPYEKMMIQKPGYQKRDKSPPADVPPRCGDCIRKLKDDKQPER